MLPLSGCSSPASSFTSVDLPAPFSPSNAWISPCRASKLTPSSARTPGYAFVTSVSVIAGALDLPFGADTVRKIAGAAGPRRAGSRGQRRYFS